MSDTIRVVLIDDSDDIRDLIGLALRRDERFDIVAEATDGEQGLIAIDQNNPDLVLLDLAMPVKDGLEVIAELQAGEADSPVVIVLSGFSSGPPESAAIEAGAAGYIEKGLSLKEMGDRVYELYTTARAKV